ncbi:hypothetical protein [Staphylococcus phage SA3]|uniref:Uncharacterized protein n=5 Tax=Kayvirus TaxID=1857843 RepID=A0A7G7WVH9_9CAUD|nr:hypothetical protein qdsa002_231 [Staphylococcus phage qdsa002]ASZ78136.1 hypothetical protein [Staphylococcus phage SA3]AUG85639.1 hypothetical protein HSA30_gp135 [Staphylococcus phage HSA30]QEQ93195.1 hypothetical protein [Staphylococcus phage vB_SauH_IME522]QNH71223.1 hypothetical protein StAP1_091 [Staphylococcus phage vB_SauH_SAP1]QWY14737.1 hypothetical protein SAP23_GM000220 [Staphylococcus phage SAP23]QZQ74808.1 hypothetical protein [Staphylococcus phage vB_ScoM-PSC1]UQJ95887.1 h
MDLFAKIIIMSIGVVPLITFMVCLAITDYYNRH